MNCDCIIDYHIITDPSTLSKTSSANIPSSATVVNGVDVSGISNGGGTTEGFIVDFEIAPLTHQLWQDPMIPKIMDHSSEFYLMDSAS
jgi:guanine nucleotide-binding protein G(i) subunit alpha